MPRERAPDSPAIRTWNRRIVGWGCAPALALGIIGGLAPTLAQPLALAGTAAAMFVAGPIAVHVWRLRRRNQARFDAARAEAAASDKRVRVVVRPDGEHEYALRDVEPIVPVFAVPAEGDDPATST